MSHFLYINVTNILIKVVNDSTMCYYQRKYFKNMFEVGNKHSSLDRSIVMKYSQLLLLEN